MGGRSPCVVLRDASLPDLLDTTLRTTPELLAGVSEKIALVAAEVKARAPEQRTEAQELFKERVQMRERLREE